MSYDVWLRADLGGPEPITIDDNINHTSNTSQMWREAGCDLASLDGESAATCIPLLEHAIADISNRKDHYRKWEAANGWGTVESTICFLGQILELCRKAPRAELVVSR